MKALLLAGGLGTRLRPITDTIPKCMVPIAGKPLLQYWLDDLIAIGCEEILINTHYLHEQVDQFIASSKYRDKIVLSYEPQLLGTLGTLRNNQSFLDDNPLLVAHADNYCRNDWIGFIKAHQSRPRECNLTMMLFETDNPSSCGMVELDQQGVVSSYVQKPQYPTGNRLANGAVLIAEPSAIRQMIDGDPSWNDIAGDFIPTRVGKMNSFFCTDTLIDVGTPETYKKACDIALGKPSS